MHLSTNQNDQVHHNIFIGDHAGQKFVRGAYNIFLGDGAGSDIVECSNTLIVKAAGHVFTKAISVQQWEMFAAMLHGADAKKIGRTISPYFRKLP